MNQAPPQKPTTFDIVEIDDRRKQTDSSNNRYERNFTGILGDKHVENYYGSVGSNIRIFFSIETGKEFNVYDAFEARGTEPHKAFKEVMPEVLYQLGLPTTTKATWSRKAGCSMCPCSPGFVLDKVKAGGWKNNNIWVRVALSKEGVLALAPKDPARVAAAERLRQGML